MSYQDNLASQGLIGQPPRPEWEKQWPDYMLVGFDLWRAGSRGFGAIDPTPFKPQHEWTAEEAAAVAAEQARLSALESGRQ